MPQNPEFQAQLRVRYKDTDRMGVVYYGNYLTFFEVARAEYMRQLGFSYARLEAEGYSLVVIEAALKYHANVGYDALLGIKVRVAELRQVRLRFDYEVFDESGQLLVSGHTAHACVNSGGRPTRIPAPLRSLLAGHTG